jgi:lysine N6-hydroxylase
VLVVGGGQSAGEIVLDLLAGRTGLPRCLSWVTGSAGLRPLDDSPFANEWFNPRFVEHFRELTAGQRAALLDRQRAADHGVSGGLLARVYRRLYELDYLSGSAFSHEILAGWRLAELAEDRDGCRAVVLDTVTGVAREIRCDAVVLATGYRPGRPAFMAPLHDRMPRDGDGYAVCGDYRVRWDGPDRNRIYLQNGALRSHGVADPNLGLAAWRSAVIINSLLDREHYALKGDDITLSLQSGTLSGAAGTAR